MSKSKGNFYTVRDIIGKGVPPSVLRYELMRSHYRKNMDFSMKGLCDCQKAVKRLRDFVATHPDVIIESHKMGETDIEKRFAEALADDLNMSKALGEVFTWVNETSNPSAEDVAALKRMDHVLGILEESELAVEMPECDGLSDEVIQEKVNALSKAREDKDYATSDAIRDELIGAGIELQISKEGVTWQKKIQVDD